MKTHKTSAKNTEQPRKDKENIQTKHEKGSNKIFNPNSFFTDEHISMNMTNQNESSDNVVFALNTPLREIRYLQTRILTDVQAIHRPVHLELQHHRCETNKPENHPTTTKSK
jgi:hypothetical protein